MLMSGLLLAPSARASDRIGESMPSLSDCPLEGDVPSLEGKVVLLDFWASWCAPCKASFPAMADLHKQFADRGVVILAVSVDDDAQAYSRFIARTSPPFHTVRDRGHKLVASLEVPTMPTSFLVDRNGVIRFRHAGFHGKETIDSYVREIEQLLAENKS